jgi:hypothetical protein
MGFVSVVVESGAPVFACAGVHRRLMIIASTGGGAG